MKATAFLIFGPSGAGKSSVAVAMAEAMDRCAHIEVDALRYLVRGGLVAWSRGTRPTKDPVEHGRQCSLGYRNAAGLCRSFGGEGFSTVVEGLGEECLPGTGWAEEALSGLRVRSAALLCEPGELRRRLSRRPGWAAPLVDAAMRDLAWYEANATRFDRAMDTTGLEPNQVAEAVLESLAV